MVAFLGAKCESCDAFTLDELDLSDPGHVICRSCGTKLDPFAPPGTALKGKIWRDGMSKSKGLLADVQMAFRPQNNRDGALGRHERLIDKQNNHYFEQVTIYETGEVTHLCDEPLSVHQGHGSAKVR